MAKSIRLHDLAELDSPMAAPSSHGFWEHWFEMQPARPARAKIDEHGIWEKAVTLEILAMDEVKY
jgi:hypothetical protein